MKLTALTFAAPIALVLSACAPRAAPTAAPAPSTPRALPPVTLLEAPVNWHLDTLGIDLVRAERELLAGKEPKRTVVVAVIDNGIDTAHTKLRAQLWKNPREIPGNGRDDDGNGFTDDVSGWNFIGGRDGRYVEHDTYELTRLAAQCKDATRRASIPAPYNARCSEIESEFERKRGEIDQTLMQVRQIDALMTQILPYLRRAAGTDTLTITNVTAIQPANDTVRQARSVFLQLAGAGITPDELEDAKKSYTSQAQYGFNLSFDPRGIVGDDYPDTLVQRYGNADLTGPGGDHGSHVAGIVGALSQGTGSRGIAQSVRIMAVRAVPSGDERDKDVANAIRYAADNGAHIINMSFGKPYSPYKALVDAAVKYADGKGVLMVHGSGNDGVDITKSESFPNPTYLDGGRPVNWITVGATSWKMGDSVVATFSNYGRPAVDVFAPGVDIYSTVPGDKFRSTSGTSMASPVVAGLAALLMSYYPNLSATDVKRIILESSTKLADHMVVRPGSADEPRVPFGELSATGGIVNAYSAIKMAEQLSAGRE